MARAGTIAAIATAPGRGGVAIVRVSGDAAFAIAAAIARKKPQVGRIVYAQFRRPNQEDRELLDSGLLLAFAAPHSYTGEDVVEFHCHGGAVAPRRVLEACFACGARLARRGEFTERAFLNGKLDLEAAESVLDLINARTDRAAAAALAGMGGERKRRLRALYDGALALSTEIEHALDIDEGELPDDFTPRLNAALAALKAQFAEARRRAREGKLLRDGALVVLAGPPNAGKSSLMNALLGENRAIVSATPGTTRDSIEEGLEIAGFPVRLVDTAGLRTAADAIEGEGVRRAEDLIAQADVVLALGACALPPVSRRAPRVLKIHAKCDLDANRDPAAGVRVSAVTGEGLDDLKRAIAAALEALAESGDCRGNDSEDGRTAFDHSTAALLEAEAQLPATVDDLVLAGGALRRVCETLGAFLGATYSADLLDNLFSRFCVGK